MKNVNIKTILFLNLPHATRVQRRYMCSYNTPSMLFPPIEFFYLASIAREWHGMAVSFTDAIAENLSMQEFIESVSLFKPDMLVCLTGFEIFEEDIKIVNALKAAFNTIQFVLFGHYPTHFPQETFLHCGADFLLEGEPDINFSNLLDYLTGATSAGGS
jgi:radical SAM superfamily enzyme YgiQ (UPF0313 family)